MCPKQLSPLEASRKLPWMFCFWVTVFQVKDNRRETFTRISPADRLTEALIAAVSGVRVVLIDW